MRYVTPRQDESGLFAITYYDRNGFVLREVVTTLDEIVDDAYQEDEAYATVLPFSEPI